MKLLSLNVWGGTLYAALVSFLQGLESSVDIFCFQEVFRRPAHVQQFEQRGSQANLFADLEHALPNFNGVFTRTSSGHDLAGPVEAPVDFGLAVFANKKISIQSNATYPIYGKISDRVNRQFTNIPRSLQQVVLTTPHGALHIFNYHGIPKPGDKLDTNERLEQSRKVKAIVGATPGPKILCGDFNLLPQTQSLKILASGLKNLIKDYNIASTRNKVSCQKYGNIQHFADYTFTSPEIRVLDFQVPYNEISDHLPMILEFELQAV